MANTTRRMHWMCAIVVSLSVIVFSLNGCSTSEAASPPAPSPQTLPQEEPRTPQGAGDIFYVSLSGNDSNPGTKARPWRTIQKAADTLVAGETVYIKAGTYEEQVVPQNSGTASNYIVYAAYPGDTVTIDGENVSLP